MNEHALVIFVKNPVRGKVKTRLADYIGSDAALRIYCYLLEYTRKITAKVNAAKFVYYNDFIGEDAWNGDLYQKRLQQGNTLGERMSEAFKEVFSEGYRKAAIIGSDCIELSTAIINQSFQLLEEADMVIGPAKDGGYYLLGMKQFHPELFQIKVWSTNTVLKETCAVMRDLKLSYALLPELSDVDRVEDLTEEMWKLVDGC